jgi:hypothetical protein
LLLWPPPRHHHQTHTGELGGGETDLGELFGEIGAHAHELRALSGEHHRPLHPLLPFPVPVCTVIMNFIYKYKIYRNRENMNLIIFKVI